MYLGIEIGGTKLQLGLGPGDGILAALWRGAVDVAAGPEGIRRQITAAVPELLARAGLEHAQIQGVGIGFGGPVDDATRTIIKSHQIAGWDNFALADWITAITSWPAVLGNDADVAGLAEALFGAGKGLSPIFYITVGSGIGGGLIINGAIYRGCGRGAAEIGHLKSVPEMAPIVEDVASGWAIGKSARDGIGDMKKLSDPDFRERFLRDFMENFARQRTGRIQDTVLKRLTLGQTQRLTARHVAEAAAQGDEFALEVLNAALGRLAAAINQVLVLLCPRRFVIGGGVSLIGDELFFQPLRALVAKEAFPPFVGCYDIVSATLGEEVVVHGALALARKRFQETK